MKRRIILGTYVLSAGYYDAYYTKAQKVRTLIRNDFMEAFKTVDALITPTAPTPAFKIGEKSSDPMALYLADVFTVSISMAGLPGIAVPCGFSKNNLPIGMQLVGKPFQEAELMAIADVYDREHRWGMKEAKV